MNLPGSKTYDRLPWVCPVRLSDGRIAAICIYVDDVRLTGSSSKVSTSRKEAASVADSLEFRTLQGRGVSHQNTGAHGLDRSLRLKRECS
jgi:hypothetical protein